MLSRDHFEFNEILAFYGLAYWYTWQVTILGLGPIWMSQNEALKRHASQLLREGAIFAFGLSERAHGADMARYQQVWRDHVYALRSTYEMNP